MLLFASLRAVAQDAEWEAFVDAFALDEELAEGDEWQDCLLELKQLHEQPLNINTATQEELRRLPFLAEWQIEEIHAYIYLHGEMQTLGELMLIPDLDATTRQRLRLFVRAETTSPSRQPIKGLASLFHDVRHDFNTRLDVPLYYRRGFLVDDGYRGDPLYHRMRYTLQSSRLAVGLRIEKDPGERFYDSHGGYVQLRQLGCASQILLGDYRASFGEGLVMGGSGWHSKSAPSMRQLGGLRPMTGTSESGFLRGAAATFQCNRHLSVSALLSHQSLDATLTSDGEVQTFITNGLHRSASEYAKHHNTQATLAGADVTWRKASADNLLKDFYIGATGYYQTFSRTLNPGDDLYRRFYPQGQHFGVAGVHYGGRYHDLIVGGETALNSGAWGIATLNRLSYIVNAHHTLSLVGRYYSSAYTSFHASAFGEASRVQNESGVLLHWTGQPWAAWQFTAYADFFYHRWPTFGMTHSNQGQEAMLQVVGTPIKRHRFTASYRWKNKEAYDTLDAHHRANVQWTFTPNQQWTCSVKGFLHHAPSGTGLAMQGAVQHALSQPSLRWSAMLAYAHTPDYATRIYLSEPSLYQSIASTSLYGHCLRAALAVRWTCLKGRLTLEGRYGMLHYFDRSTQSSGLQTIYSSWKNDLQMQLRLRL